MAQTTYGYNLPKSIAGNLAEEKGNGHECIRHDLQSVAEEAQYRADTEEMNKAYNDFRAAIEMLPLQENTLDRIWDSMIHCVTVGNKQAFKDGFKIGAGFREEMR